MVKSKNETRKNIRNYQGKGVTKKRQFKKRKQRKVLKGGAEGETQKPSFDVKQSDGVEIVVKEFPVDSSVLKKNNDDFTITLDESIFTNKLAGSNASKQLKGLENRFPVTVGVLIGQDGKEINKSGGGKPETYILIPAGFILPIVNGDKYVINIKKMGRYMN